MDGAWIAAEEVAGEEDRGGTVARLVREVFLGLL